MLLTSLVLMTLNSVSQNSKNDSITCIPNGQLRTALRLIEKGDFAQQRLRFADSNISILQQRIKDKDDIISEFKSQDTQNQALTATAELRIKNAEDRAKLDREWVNKLNDDLRKQKRKTVFAWIVGAVGIVASILIVK
jgi:hypothetical protein